MKIHNLLKNPNDLPPIEEGNRHSESREVLLLYRTIEYDYSTDQYKSEITSIGRGFYVYDEQEWYNLYDEPMSRMCDIPGCGGGQEVDNVEYLMDECGYSKELIDQLTKVKTFKCEDLEGNYVFIKEIIGWFEIPTFDEFIKDAA